MINVELNQNNDIKINITEEQIKISNSFFEKILAHYEDISTKEFGASIKRLGLVSFRLAMIFTALRIMEDEKFSDERECSDKDFKNINKVHKENMIVELYFDFYIDEEENKTFLGQQTIK